MEVGKGVQLPPDSTGRITAGYVIQIFNEDTGEFEDVTIPATVLVDASGGEIGTGIGKELEEIKLLLTELLDVNKQIHEALTR